MVDKVRVLRLLRSISDDLAVLRAEASADAERRADLLGIVLERLANLTDLDDFVAAVAAWVVPPRS